MKHMDSKQDKAMMTKVASKKVAEHEAKMHGKAPKKMANGGMVKGYANGGLVKGMAPNTPAGVCGPGVRSQQDYKK